MAIHPCSLLAPRAAFWLSLKRGATRMASVASTRMMLITTSSSTSVNPPRAAGWLCLMGLPSLRSGFAQVVAENVVGGAERLVGPGRDDRRPGRVAADAAQLERRAPGIDDDLRAVADALN